MGECFFFYLLLFIDYLPLAISDNKFSTSFKLSKKSSELLFNFSYWLSPFKQLDPPAVMTSLFLDFFIGLSIPFKKS